LPKTAGGWLKPDSKLAERRIAPRRECARKFQKDEFKRAARVLQGPDPAD